MELQVWSRFVSLINSYHLTYVKCWVDMAVAVRREGKRRLGLVLAPGDKTQPQTCRYNADAVRCVKKVATAISYGKYFAAKRLEKRTLSDAVARYQQNYLPQLTDQRSRKNPLNWWVDELGQRTVQHLNPDNESVFPKPPNWAVNLWLQEVN
jgi:hypothetical protein